jgi:hypothetical protein
MKNYLIMPKKPKTFIFTIISGEVKFVATASAVITIYPNIASIPESF